MYRNSVLLELKEKIEFYNEELWKTLINLDHSQEK